MYTDMWEIQDKNGVIHSGTDEEMTWAWIIMTCHSLTAENLLMDRLSEKEFETAYEKYNCEWEGDLKLVQIHEIYT